VFTPNNTSVASGSSKLTTTFPVDSTLTKGVPWAFNDRLRGAGQLLYTTSDGSQTSGTASAWQLDFNDGYEVNADDIGPIKPSYGFQRAPGYFDVVCYTGTGVTGLTVNHNLTVTPEWIIVKNRGAVRPWFVQQKDLGATQGIILNDTGAAYSDSGLWNNTAPTASVFTVGAGANVNASGNTYVAYLFATCPGVSKVGSYTGTGATQVINCGFTAGSRFVLIKRTDSTGDWYVWDSARGIVAGNDPYLLLNSTAAEVTNTDYVDTAATGFEISSTAPAAINASGGTFIFLAIA
jgi:hypothetical protein